MPSAPLSPLLRRFAPLLAWSLVLLWHSLQYNFVTDDAYISFVFARNFAEHGQLVFNAGGTPVEGYTNFTWTLLLGVLMWLGLPPEVMSLVLGTAFGIATLWVGWRLMVHVLDDRDSAWAHLPAGFLAMSAGYACWSSGGLETQLFTFLVTTAITLYALAKERAALLPWMAAVLALACMTRPEGLLVVGVIGGHRLAGNIAGERRVLPSRDEWRCLAVFLLIWAPWQAWRWWYYGYPLPNTYYVKAAGQPPNPEAYHRALIANGLYYVGQWLRQTGLLVGAPIALAGLVVARWRSRRFYLGSVLVPLTALYLIYTVRVGGDFMGLHRFIMPLLVFAALGMALGLWLLASTLPSRLRSWAPFVIALLLAAYGVSQWRLTVRSLAPDNWRADHGIDTPGYLWVYAHDRALIGAHMRDCFTDDDFSIVGGAGAKPYVGRVRSIDVFGLVSEVIAQQVPPTRPRAGHNKWGPDALLHEVYEPTFVFSCYALHPTPAAPSLPCASYWLRHGYERVTLHIPGLLERGEYYTFLKQRTRDFTCPGLSP